MNERQEPECIRMGNPYDKPAFEALCREMGIWGTANAALCAIFWRKAEADLAESIGAGGMGALRPATIIVQHEAEPATNPFVIKQIIDERKDALDMVWKVETLNVDLEEKIETLLEWISVKDQPPGFIQSCDWLFPVSHLKCERWMLCGESSMTASVPGAATHWRPAQALPLV